MNTAAQHFAAHYAALPAHFRAEHPRPLINLNHAKVSAWLNRLHAGVETACRNYLHMATVAQGAGDIEGAAIVLDEARPYRMVMADLDRLARKGK